MRIVSLVPSATESIAALGLQADLVGITHSCDHPSDLQAERVTSTFIPTDAPSATIDRIVKERARSGQPLYELDTSLLEELRPDLVVTQGVCDVCAVSEGQAMAGLDELSIRPRVVALHPHRLVDVLKDIQCLGDAARVPGRASDVLTGLQERIRRVKTRVAQRPRISVVVLEWIDPLYSCGHWTPEIVELAGGLEMIARPGQPSREMTWNEIREADPQVLVLACCGQDVRRTLEDLGHLESRPGFADLRAVRTDRVFVADGGAHFSRPGPRLIESLELLAATLHPSGDPHEAGLRRASLKGISEP